VELIGIDNRTVTIRTPDEERIPLLVDGLVRAGARIYAVTPHRRTLEDVFMEAIGLEGGTPLHGLERDEMAMGGQV
jgi:ABC-2 type transport system ATP-binding protein